MEGAELIAEVVAGFRGMIDRAGAAEVNETIKAVLGHCIPDGFHDADGMLPRAGRAFAQERLHLCPVEFAGSLTAALHELAGGMEALGIDDANAMRLALPFVIAASMEHGRLNRPERPRKVGGVTLQ